MSGRSNRSNFLNSTLGFFSGLTNGDELVLPLAAFLLAVGRISSRSAAEEGVNPRLAELDDEDWRSRGVNPLVRPFGGRLILGPSERLLSNDSLSDSLTLLRCENDDRELLLLLVLLLLLLGCREDVPGA